MYKERQKEVEYKQGLFEPNSWFMNLLENIDNRNLDQEEQQE